MKVFNDNIQLNTRGNADIIDITGDVKSVLHKSEIVNGLVCVFVPGSTGAITTIEFEPGVLDDLKNFLEEIIPSNREYLHDRAWGDGNGHSHLRAALIGPSFTVPVMDSTMQLGTWQQIVFLDFDNKTRNRKLVVQILGE